MFFLKKVLLSGCSLGFPQNVLKLFVAMLFLFGDKRCHFFGADIIDKRYDGKDDPAMQDDPLVAKTDVTFTKRGFLEVGISVESKKPISWFTKPDKYKGHLLYAFKNASNQVVGKYKVDFELEDGIYYIKDPTNSFQLNFVGKDNNGSKKEETPNNYLEVENDEEIQETVKSLTVTLKKDATEHQGYYPHTWFFLASLVCSVIGLSAYLTARILGKK